MSGQDWPNCPEHLVDHILYDPDAGSRVTVQAVGGELRLYRRQSGGQWTSGRKLTDQDATRLLGQLKQSVDSVMAIEQQISRS